MLQAHAARLRGRRASPGSKSTRARRCPDSSAPRPMVVADARARLRFAPGRTASPAVRWRDRRAGTPATALRSPAAGRRAVADRPLPSRPAARRRRCSSRLPEQAVVQPGGGATSASSASSAGAPAGKAARSARSVALRPSNTGRRSCRRAADGVGPLARRLRVPDRLRPGSRVARATVPPHGAARRWFPVTSVAAPVAGGRRIGGGSETTTGLRRAM